MRKMNVKQCLIALCLSIILGVFNTAFAISLSEAKAQGVIGEQPNGYLGVVGSNPSAEVQALVEQINAQRRVSYVRIAQKRSTTLQSVEQVAGSELTKGTQGGQYYRAVNGNWQKR